MRSQFKSIARGWKALGTAERGWFLAAIALLGMIGAGEWLLHSGKSEVQRLYNTLSAQEEAQVLAYLRQHEIPFGIRGDSIFVANEMADSLRAQIVEKKVMNSGVLATPRKSFGNAVAASFTEESVRPACNLGGR